MSLASGFTAPSREAAFKSSFVHQLGLALFAGVFGVSVAANDAKAQNTAPSATTHFVTALKTGMPGNKGHALGGQKVGACVVDLWDTTISKTAERFEMERRATVAALRSPEFGKALKMVKYGQIGLNMALFNDVQTSITGGWVLVDNKSRFDLADKIEKIPMGPTGYTETHRAVLFALGELETCQSDVNIIDIVTDGKANQRGLCEAPYNCVEAIPFMQAARREASYRHVTINVLAAEVDTSVGLGDYARTFMATPSYAAQTAEGLHWSHHAGTGKVFEINGTDFSDPAAWEAKFTEMRRRKLIEEIAERPAVRNNG